MMPVSEDPYLTVANDDTYLAVAGEDPYLAVESEDAYLTVNTQKSEGEYSWLSLSRTPKGPENLFEIEIVRDRERNKTKYTMDPGIYFLMKTNK